jgi:peptidoglycan/xylan/chitin deacetylase (PgdA/CDA1 family)
MTPDSIPFVPLLLAAGSAGLLSAGGLLAYTVFSPRCQFWAPVVRSLPQAEAVALTFDDGPHPEFTPRVLDTLAAHGATATFFVIGRYARQHPALLRRMHAEGHTLGNHTYDHDHFGINRGRDYWDRQLADTQQAVADAVGRRPVLFRPPMGFKNWHVAATAKAQRLPIVGWSVRAYDTRPADPPALARRVIARTGGHDILLLHDGVDPARAARGAATQQHTVEALPAILAGVREKKLQVTSLVDALLAAAADREQAAARVRARAAT